MRIRYVLALMLISWLLGARFAAHAEPAEDVEQAATFQELMAAANYASPEYDPTQGDAEVELEPNLPK